MLTPFVEEAARARAAQQEWVKEPLSERLDCIRKLRKLLIERAEKLALTVTAELDRPAAEVLATDILPLADGLRFLERHATKTLAPRKIKRKERPVWLIGSKDVVYRRPRGVVGIIGTWNYPLFLNCGQIAQALVAGNAVLWKPSELMPETALAIDEIFRLAGFPDDLLITLPSDRDAGSRLLESDIDHLVFTGSASVGKKIAVRLAERLIPSTLELSGIDAMVVLHQANVDMAVKAAWFGAMINRGQTCVAVRRCFVHRELYQSFIDKLRPIAENSRPELLAMRGQAEQAERLIADAIRGGAKLLAPGVAPLAEFEPTRFPPSIVYDATPEMSICQEGSFAPIMAIIPYDHTSEVVAAHHACPFGLGSSIFGTNIAMAEQLAAKLETGVVTINDVVLAVGAPGTPFGGRRNSGWGVTQGPEGLLEMTVPQVVSIKKGTLRPHYDSSIDPDPYQGALFTGMIGMTHDSSIKGKLKSLRRLMKAGVGTVRRKIALKSPAVETKTGG
jgi:acyl-CoA reductase-like NAD-dependent aldehyde dehydrogenase